MRPHDEDSLSVAVVDGLNVVFNFLAALSQWPLTGRYTDSTVVPVIFTTALNVLMDIQPPEL